MEQTTSHKKLDYLIIGQGLVGTCLSYYALQAGKTCMVVNDSHTASASQVASGVINPVTGRRIVQTWMIETFLPFALKAYSDLGAQLNATIVREAPVILIHPSLQMQESFEYRYEHENVYLQKNNASNFEAFMHAPFGTGQINQTVWIDLNLMIAGWRAQLIKHQQYIDTKFDIADLQITNEGVAWKGIQAKRIVFSDGLDTDKYIKIDREVRKFAQPIGGIGKHFTNDVGAVPLNIVIKMTSFNGIPVVKLSDNPSKNTGNQDDIRKVKEELGIT